MTEEIREAVRAIRRIREALRPNVLSTVPIDPKDFDRWLGELQKWYEQHPGASLSDDVVVAQINFNATAKAKLLEGVFTFAATGLKILLLINGGAAIAILAYLGHFPPGTYYPEEIIKALGYFSYGAGVTAMTALGAYLAQVLFSEGLGWPDDLGQRIAVVVRLVCILLAGAAVGLFLYGVCMAVKAFSMPP